jgi:hypothetical protein
VSLLSCTAGSRADAFEAYQLTERFELPFGAAVFAVLPDGRIVTLAGSDVLVETGVGTRTFISLGTLPSADIASFGPAFLRVSPDGTHIAVGNNGGASFDNFEIGVFELTTLTGDWFSASHFDAAWIDDRYLAVTSGDFVDPSVVTALDTQNADPDNPVNTTIITNIGGASGGIAFDAGGYLYTGNGFTFIGPSGTGTVKAFAPAAWQAALSGGPAVDFENDGTLVVDVLSASPLVLDGEGNLIVGGGDFGGVDDSDFVAVVHHDAVGSALGGGGPADPGDPLEVRRLDPDLSTDFNFYAAVYSPISGELYVSDSGAGSVFVYTPNAPVPAATTWGLALLSLAMCVAATQRIRSVQGVGHHTARV